MNPYIKQFPDLMAGKKIMYVHGFLSSAQSGTVKMLQELMPNATLLAEDIPVHPEEGIEMLQKMAETEKPDLIIGTSMGGMYTELLKGFDRILVNPAFEMGNTMSSMTGKQEFQNPRKDGVNELMVNKGLIKEYRDFTERCFQDITPEEQQRVYGLFGDADPLVHTFDLFHEHYPLAIPFHGEHRLIDKVAFHYLCPVIRWIDDKQNGKERPIVYIDFDALHDSYMKATSSMHKAYEMLIEHYNVYIVAPAPTNDHEYMLTSYSPCFRKEKGAHGIEERGIYRIHQFEKQEMIVVCRPEESADWYEKLWKNSVELFRNMEIPVRQLNCCSGDLADLKVKSCDIEAWSPRQQKYFEVCSCSNLGDAQARRLHIRVKGKDGKTYLAHTLNNTCVAPPRMLIAFLENHLQADGSVTIPKVLQPYMGGLEVMVPTHKKG